MSAIKNPLSIMQLKARPIILIDGSGFIFRAYYSLPPLSNAEGMPTGAIYGTLNMIQKLIHKYQPCQVAIVFDHKGKNFRNDLFPAYKTNRPPIDNNLRIQIEPLHEILRYSGLPLLVVPKVEADDVIGTLAMQATRLKKYTLIASSDKDMAQLVSDNVHMLDPMKEIILDATAIKEKYGIHPDQVIDFMALIGDSVDNIKGVNGVGPKTAIKWLNEYKSLDKLLEYVHQIKGKVGEKLRASKSTIALDKQLVTIKIDCELKYDINTLQAKNPDPNKLIELFSKYDFKRWLKQTKNGENIFALDSQRTSPTTPTITSQPNSREVDKSTNKNYSCIITLDQWQNFLQKLYAKKLFAFDTETTGLDTFTAELVGISFSLQPNTGVYVPLLSNSGTTHLQLEDIKEELKKLLNDTSLQIIGQNLKFDLKILNNYGIEVNNQIYDTMLEAYVYDSVGNNNLDALSIKYLNKSTIKLKDITDNFKISFADIDLATATEYAAEDADLALQLHLWFQANSDNKLKSIYKKFEQPLLKVIQTIETNGVTIDVDMLNEQNKDIDKKISNLKTIIISLAGEDFNLNSTKQLQHILFTKMQLPILRKTPKGQPSTAEATLNEMANNGIKLPKLILEYRSLFKLKTTYIEALPKAIHPKTNRIHTNYHQAVTSTGRLSSSNPNLQNIPIRTNEGRKIRKAFITSKNKMLLAADFSQIELRIMAHISQDDGLISAFNNNLDIHTATASEIFNTSIDNTSNEQRRAAKAVNFGLIYGMQAFGLAKQLGTDRNQAQSYIDTYFSRYPKVAQFMNDIKLTAKKQGFVETIFGRRLKLNDINSSNRTIREYAERTAINAPMQGSAADIIKLAMIAIHKLVKDKPNLIKVIMQVHDELVFEIDKAQNIEATMQMLVDTMQNVCQLKVPLIVDAKFGQNWDEAH